MLKKINSYIIILLIIGFTQSSCSQKGVNLKQILTEKFPEESNIDGKWVYYEKEAKIKEIEFVELKKHLLNYRFFKINLTNYLGHHINKSECLILYNEINSNIILVEPHWYNGINIDFFKMFIGIKFDNTNSLKSFVSEIQETILIGSTENVFKNTSYGAETITFDLMNTPYTKNDIYRNMEFKIKSNRILSFKSSNPKISESILIE